MPQSEPADTKEPEVIELDHSGNPTVQEYQTLNGDRQREAKLMSPGFDVV